jgi:hypothetical protein
MSNVHIIIVTVSLLRNPVWILVMLRFMLVADVVLASFELEDALLLCFAGFLSWSLCFQIASR